MMEKRKIEITKQKIKMKQRGKLFEVFDRERRMIEEQKCESLRLQSNSYREDVFEFFDKGEWQKNGSIKMWKITRIFEIFNREGTENIKM